MCPPLTQMCSWDPLTMRVKILLRHYVGLRIFWTLDEDGNGTLDEAEFVRGCLNDPDFSRVVQHSIQRIKLGREEEEERGGDDDHDEDNDDSDDGDGDTARDKKGWTSTI